MLNKRKAAVGWLVYTLGKPIAKRVVKSKAKGVVPSRSRSSARRRAGIPALLAGVGAVAGGLMFWRRRRSGESETPGT